MFHDLNSCAVTPAWSPDGEFIVVRRDPIGRGGVGENGLGIWMHHRNGGEGARLVTDGGAHWPSVSPDGRHVYYHDVEGGRDRDALDLPSGTPRRATPEDFAPAQEFGPAWSPDGEWITFTTLDDTGGGDLWKVRARGARPCA